MTINSHVSDFIAESGSRTMQLSMTMNFINKEFN